jgi:acetyltransferase-like isoleucine patch superfamily enzyme
MFFSIYQYWKLRKGKIKGWFFKFLYSSKRISVGKNFQCESFPSLIINKGCGLTIGDNVLLRKDVEIRSHGNSKIIIANNIRIDRGVRLLAANNSEISIDDGTRIGLYTVFNGGDSIKIGKKVLISGFVYLQTSMHNHKKDQDVQDQGYSHKPVGLKDDAWLGAHVVVLPGCLIGYGAIVGSNAVVTENIMDYNVVAGVPAKPIKERN